MDSMNIVKKWSATLLAREAVKNDNSEVFAKALVQGADLRSQVWGSSLWDATISHGAIECFKQMLPLVNVVSGPEAEIVGKFMAGGAVIPGNMGMGPSPMNPLFADACRQEFDRQTEKRSELASLAEKGALWGAAGQSALTTKARPSL